MDLLKQQEKSAAIALIKAQKALVRAMMNVQHAQMESAQQKTFPLQQPDRPPKKKQTSEEAPAVKKARTWKCAGNVLLGKANPGCPYPDAEEAPVTRVKGRGEFQTCKLCKKDIARIRKAEKKKEADASSK